MRKRGDMKSKQEKEQLLPASYGSFPDIEKKGLDNVNFFTKEACALVFNAHPIRFNEAESLLHAPLVKEIKNILSRHRATQQTEKELAALFLGSDYFMRKMEENIVHDMKDKNMRRSYVKKGKKWRRSKEEYDFETVGYEIGDRYVLQSYTRAFPTAEAFRDFVLEHQDIIPLLLEQLVYSRAPIDEEDQDSFLMQLVDDSETPLWEAHTLAALMLWKSTTLAELKKAIEIIDDVEVNMSETYEHWLKDNLMPEYRLGALNAYSYWLWQKICELAFYCRGNIEARYDERSGDIDENETNEEYVFSTLFAEAADYIEETEDNEARYIASESMREKYNFLSTVIQQEGGLRSDNPEE